MAVTALHLLAQDQIVSGDWYLANELGTEGLQLCVLTGQPQLAFPLHMCLGVVAAARGNMTEANDAIDGIMRWATPRGSWV